MKNKILKGVTILIVSLVFCFVLFPTLNLGEQLSISAANIKYIDKGCGTFTYSYSTNVSNTSYKISDTSLASVSRTVSGSKTTYKISALRPNTSANKVQTFAVYIKDKSGSIIQTLQFTQAAPVVKLNKDEATVSCIGKEKVTFKVTTNANVSIFRISGDKNVGEFSQNSINGMTEDGKTKTYTVTFTSNRNDNGRRSVSYLFQYCGAYESCSIKQTENDGFVYTEKWFWSPDTQMTGPRPPCLLDNDKSTKKYTVTAFHGNAANFDYVDEKTGKTVNITNDMLQNSAIANGIEIEYSANYKGELYVTVNGHRLKYANVQSDVYGEEISITPVYYSSSWQVTR